MLNIVLILAAQNDDGGRLNSTAVARADGGLRVFHQRPDAKILLTGAFGPNFNRAILPHAAYMARYLQQEGVAAADILPFVVSKNTVEDIFGAKALLVNYVVDSVCLVTSESHLPRARFIMACAFDVDWGTFVGTPDAVSPQTLAVLQAHEKRAMGILERQGGVVYNGRLYRKAI